MNNFIQNGDTLTATLAGAVVSGQLVLLGNTKLPAVAAGSYGANTEGEYNLCGVYEFPADAPSAGVVGDAAYFDAANNVVTATAQGNSQVGVYAAPKVANAVIARVRLMPAI
jgi:predicted RecA/RadA family phage recombinase